MKTIHRLKIVTLLLSAFVLSLLSGCATLTPEQKADLLNRFARAAINATLTIGLHEWSKSNPEVAIWANGLSSIMRDLVVDRQTLNEDALKDTLMAWIDDHVDDPFYRYQLKQMVGEAMLAYKEYFAENMQLDTQSERVAFLLAFANRIKLAVAPPDVVGADLPFYIGN